MFTVRARLAVRGLATAAAVAALAVGLTPGAEASTGTGAGTNTLGTNQRLQPGQNLISANGTYLLVMQTDCNLVEYRARDMVALWNSGTPGKGSGCWAGMQSDGNLVVYTSAGSAVWYSATDGSTGSSAILQEDGNFVIYHGQQAVWAVQGSSAVYLGDTFGASAQLRANEWVYSDNHAYELVMQADCNLVLYRVSGMVAQWNSGTPGKGSGCSTVMQTDGNLVVYTSASVAVWNSGTAGHQGDYLDVRNDGTLAVIGNGTQLWPVQTAPANSLNARIIAAAATHATGSTGGTCARFVEQVVREAGGPSISLGSVLTAYQSHWALYATQVSWSLAGDPWRHRAVPERHQGAHVDHHQWQYGCDRTDRRLELGVARGREGASRDLRQPQQGCVRRALHDLARPRLSGG